MRLRHLSVAALALAAIAVSSTPAAANPFAKGPDPTVTSLRSGYGSYGVTAVKVNDSASNSFGTGTIWRPATTTGEKFGMIVMAPGFTETTSATAWLGNRLASNGFVVFAFNTNGLLDQPVDRGRALIRALDYLKVASASSQLVDPNRQAVLGHSMGGGGAMQATKTRPGIKASVALTPWHTDSTWPEIETPTMVIGVGDDVIAPVFMHAQPLYRGMTRPGTKKAYLEYATGSHFQTNAYSGKTMGAVLSWMKRFVDDDTRYSPFICPQPGAMYPGDFSTYQSTCPF